MSILTLHHHLPWIHYHRHLVLVPPRAVHQVAVGFPRSVAHATHRWTPSIVSGPEVRLHLLLPRHRLHLDRHRCREGIIHLEVVLRLRLLRTLTEHRRPVQFQSHQRIRSVTHHHQLHRRTALDHLSRRTDNTRVVPRHHTIILHRTTSPSNHTCNRICKLLLHHLRTGHHLKCRHHNIRHSRSNRSNKNISATTHSRLQDNTMILYIILICFMIPGQIWIF
mmetsp:Transcript_54629/g.132663  ORF Transcript_54629/g.132663 Transcript_54629/m.132663 type:complete len:222 (+) Transcript_54629:1218-1883(+)